MSALAYSTDRAGCVSHPTPTRRCTHVGLADGFTAGEWTCWFRGGNLRGVCGGGCYATGQLHLNRRLTTANPTVQVSIITAHARAESNISMRKSDCQYSMGTSVPSVVWVPQALLLRRETWRGAAQPGKYSTVGEPRNRALFSHPRKPSGLRHL